MSEYRERATELFKQGYNCSQAVLASFCEDMDMDFETALKLSSSFGGGMGRLREVCGAVSAMFMIAGIRFGYADPDDKLAKAEHYKLIQLLAEQFKARNGSLVCRELLGLAGQDGGYSPEERTGQYYQKRPCAELVGDAADIISELIESKA